jgi:hypothetical protein
MTQPKRITQKEIEELKQLEKEATPGEWSFDVFGMCIRIFGSSAANYATCENKKDLLCFAAARNALSKLIEEVERLRGVMEDACDEAQLSDEHAMDVIHEEVEAWQSEKKEDET